MWAKTKDGGKMKSYTDINQSKKLAEILPLKSADMYYEPSAGFNTHPSEVRIGDIKYAHPLSIPCWSLAALLNYIKDKCSYFELVYLNSTIDGRANILKNVYRLSTDMYDVYEKEAIDACYEIIIKLHELKML